jgi:hypothetical protein
MVEPDNLVLEYLRGIRTDLGKMADWMQTLSVGMTAYGSTLRVVTIQEHDHTDISAIKLRLDRIEKRLKLAD